MPIFKDLTGQRAGSLVVTNFLGMNSKKRAVFKCKCDCGEIAIVMGQALSQVILGKPGGTRSCGCMQRQREPKPITPERIPHMWHAMALNEVRIVEDLTTSQFHAQVGKTRSKHSDCRTWRWTARKIDGGKIEVRRIQ